MQFNSLSDPVGWISEEETSGIALYFSALLHESRCNSRGGAVHGKAGIKSVYCIFERSVYLSYARP